MKRLKKFFDTPWKAVVSCLCILAAVGLLGTGTVYAAGAVAKNNSIGAVNAQNYAFADAGIDPASVDFVKADFSFEQGQFIYEVKFAVDETEYEYWIKASDGTVLKKELEQERNNGTDKVITAKITLEDAKKAALNDAGLAASQVTFIKEKLDWDSGIAVYDIEFYTSNTKFEYEINADTGVVYSKSKEITRNPETVSSGQSEVQSQPVQQVSSEPQQGENTAPNGQISIETAKGNVLSDAGVESSAATFTKVKLEYDDGIAIYEIKFYTAAHQYEYELNAVTGKIVSKDMEAFKTSNGNPGETSYIGVEKAKELAASHAGYPVSELIFEKVELDRDDGFSIYEIEFYHGYSEYEYKINAVTGEIMEYDASHID